MRCAERTNHIKNLKTNMWRGALLLVEADGKVEIQCRMTKNLVHTPTNITVGEHKTQPWPKVNWHSTYGRLQPAVLHVTVL